MMVLFEVITWVLFGSIAGLWADFFIRRPHHAVQLTAMGVAGALVGGAMGRLLIPAHHVAWVGTYNVAALALAVVGAVLAVGIDWFSFRRREAHALPRRPGRRS